ncbi:hypothetical protein ACIF80_15115 [Streptomyces sp. NPDC085927]|uniref:hypothetical protein n=1 Tax=Streptomyces sp. NPDC085927 TaxID=3365738 RepID=UPI0037D3FB22
MVGDEADDVGEVVQVVPGDSGVDLHLHAEGAGGVPGVQGPAEHPGDSAEVVVECGGGPDGMLLGAWYALLAVLVLTRFWPYWSTWL